MKTKQSEMTGYMFFGAMFFVEAAVTALKIKLPELPAGWFLLALGLAAYRGGRAVAFNAVFSWLRSLAGLVDLPDSSGAGDSATIPDSVQGFRRVLAGLVECPICAGTWTAAGLLLIYSLSESTGLVLIYTLAAAGIGEFLHWFSEMTAWKGRAAREEAGSQWLSKNRKPLRVYGDFPQSDGDYDPEAEEVRDSLFVEVIQKGS